MVNDEPPRWALIINGGAKAMKPGEEEDNRRGALEAVEIGRDVLAQGGSALDAVEAAIRVMERLPVFNAGFGSSLNEAEKVEMCSGIMDGRDLAVGAVGAIMGVRHPISVARRVLIEKEVLIVGEGARAFARDHHVEIVDRDALITPERLDEAHDTVGAVALDQDGNIAAGTSTGGLTGSKVGRVGDSPICGSGFYADNKVGGIAFSGDGETIARLVLASQVMARIGEDGPEAAIARALAQVPPLGGEGADGGGIAIAADGRIGWTHNSPSFVVGMATSAMNQPCVWLNKEEAREGPCPLFMRS
jgi:beta-aspartyl-peptidase (threonine type)